MDISGERAKPLEDAPRRRSVSGEEITQDAHGNWRFCPVISEQRRRAWEDVDWEVNLRLNTSDGWARVDIYPDPRGNTSAAPGSYPVLRPNGIMERRYLEGKPMHLTLLPPNRAVSDADRDRLSRVTKFFEAGPPNNRFNKTWSCTLLIRYISGFEDDPLYPGCGSHVAVIAKGRPFVNCLRDIEDMRRPHHGDLFTVSM